MAFTNESTVRAHTQLLDDEKFPKELIVGRINDAHSIILRDLNPIYANSNDQLLILAETELTAAFILRSLAAKSAVDTRQVRLPDVYYRESGKTINLIEASDKEEQSAWAHLAPFLKEPNQKFFFDSVDPVEPSDSDYRPDKYGR